MLVSLTQLFYAVIHKNRLKAADNWTKKRRNSKGKNLGEKEDTTECENQKEYYGNYN